MIKPVSTISHAIESKVVLEEYFDKYSQIQAGDGESEQRFCADEGEGGALWDYITEDIP